MLVHRVEGGAQPFAPLAVEAADRAAQPVHRLGEFGLFGGARSVLRLGFGKFVGGDQIDRPQPFARRGQALQLLRVPLGRDAAASAPSKPMRSGSSGGGQ